MRHVPLRVLGIVFAFGLLGIQARADTGVLIPASVKNEPDPSVLSFERLDVRITIRHLHASVELRSIYKSHVARPLEGRYVLPLPRGAAITDFSVWQGAERLIGTVVEKRKGRQLFESIAAQQLDPGLLESSDDNPAGRDFSLRVAPIPPYGTARVEVSYSEDLAVTSGSSELIVPLAARKYAQQRVGELHIEVTAESADPLSEVVVRPDRALTWSLAPRPGGTRFAGRLDAQDVELRQDLTLELRLGAGGPALDFAAYRDVQPGARQDLSPFGDGVIDRDTRGFFMVRTLYRPAGATPAPQTARPRDVVALLDTSLSMQWDKLDRAFMALEYLLERLGERDRFALCTFDQEVHAAAKTLLPVTAATRAAALKFVRESLLGGGTDLDAALQTGLTLLQQAPRPDAQPILVLISDGNPSLGEIGYAAIGQAFARTSAQTPAATGHPRLFVLGVGDDAQGTLLGRLATAGDGYYAELREGVSPAFILRTFLDKLGQTSLRDVALAIADLAGISDVYPPLQPAVFAGSDATFFGRYAQPGRGSFSIRGRMADAQGSTPFHAQANLVLPERAAEPSQTWVGRSWASQRIDDLLGRIATEGERDEWVQEIIALAKRFHLVTPYTSFLAAPRALLRPRVIQPGDPVLRIKTAPDIVQVVAIFPFGLTKAMDYLTDEAIWQTRFLAPAWMQDGRYPCMLVLTDRAGNKITETKHFVIDSRPPTLQAELGAHLVHAGDTLAVTVRADADTRRIRARIGDGPATDVVWDSRRKRSLGALSVPRDLPTGRTAVVLVAEDHAHNVATLELPLDVVGR